MWIVIGLLIFGFCIAGWKFFERLFAVVIGGILGLVILGFILYMIIF